MPERPKPIDAALLDPFGVRRISASEELKELIGREGANESIFVPESAKDLIEREKGALMQFFGSLRPFGRKEIQIPPLPAEITFEKFHRWQQLGMDLHFLPRIKLQPHSISEKNWKGWLIKPEEWFYKRYQYNNLRDLPGKWILVDSRDKPPYQNGQQLYEDDFLGPIIKELRQNQMLSYERNYPVETRFLISWHEYTVVLRPSIAEHLGVNLSQVRLPRAIEFNFLGNAFYPQWGQTNTYEWFEEEYGRKYGDKKDERNNHLCGGDSFKGGLAFIAHEEPDKHRPDLGFRPLVEF